MNNPILLRKTLYLLGSAAIVGLAAAFSPTTNAKSVKEFYAGKDLKFIIPSGPGGGFSLYYRLLSRHIADHLPGHPAVIDQNMPGASGLVATNWLYAQAPRDGTVIGGTFNSLLTEPLLGDSATHYNPTKFNWLGSIDTSYTDCMVWHTSPVNTIYDAMKHVVRVSTTGLSGNSAKFPLLLNKLIGTKFKVISGYSSTGMRLAVARREVDGICGYSYAAIKAGDPEWIRDHKIRFILQGGPKRIEELPKAPLLKDLVKDPRDQMVLKVLEVDQEAGKPVLFPPGVPKYLVEAMRTAFDETMKDQSFLADARRMHITPHPMQGEKIERNIKEIYALPKDIIALTARLWPPATNRIHPN